MITPQPSARVEIPPYVAIYTREPAGRWLGEVAALGIAAAADNLEDAREALAKEAKVAFAGTGLLGAPPAGIPEDALTVADRMKVSVYRTTAGHTTLVSATSHPSPVPPRNPYVSKTGKLRLRNSVVLVIDELDATSRMVNNLTEAVLTDRNSTLERARGWFGDPDTASLESLLLYTDNLVYGAPITNHMPAPTRLGFTVSAASHYQLELALQGTVLRGGIAIGRHHQSDTIVAGPALIEAHHLESQVADFPRIVLSDSTIEAIATDISYWSHGQSPYIQQLLIDEDERLFVSYLSASEEYDREARDWVKLVRRHRDLVVQNLRTTNGHRRAYRKWRWIADYHNFYVTSRGLPNALLVPYTWRKVRRFAEIEVP